MVDGVGVGGEPLVSSGLGGAGAGEVLDGGSCGLESLLGGGGRGGGRFGALEPVGVDGERG